MSHKLIPSALGVVGILALSATDVPAARTPQDCALADSVLLHTVAAIVESGPVLARLWPGYQLAPAFALTRPDTVTVLVGDVSGLSGFLPLACPNLPASLRGRAWARPGTWTGHPAGIRSITNRNGQTVGVSLGLRAEAGATADLLTHEGFHLLYQYSRLRGMARELDRELPAEVPVDPSVAAVIATELDTLAWVLTRATATERRTAAATYLALRSRRLSRQPTVSVTERQMEYVEGTAEYVGLGAGIAVRQLPGPRADLALRDTIATSLRSEALKVREDTSEARALRPRAYFSGAAIAALLQENARGWQGEVEQGVMLDAILSAALHGTRIPSIVVVTRKGRVPLPLTHSPRPTSSEIAPADLMTRLYAFADDSMGGRAAGTIQNERATAYVADEARRLGLEPAGDSGTYFQTIPLVTQSVDSASSLNVGSVPVALGTEWKAMSVSSVALQNVSIVYGGALGDTSRLIDSSEARGKLVVYRININAFTGGFAAMRGSVAPTAAAVAFAVPPFTWETFGRPQLIVDPRRSTTPSSQVKLVLSYAALAKLFDSPASLRPGSAGRQASLDLRINLVPQPHTPRNVVAVLRGRDAVLRREYVVLSAHTDHLAVSPAGVDHDSLRIYDQVVRPRGAEDVNLRASPSQQQEVNARLISWRASHTSRVRKDSIFNGADDDGSGSVGLLEIAEHLASLPTKPRRSILFVWHNAEEQGLIGSEYFVGHPSVPRDALTAALNLDGIGRGTAADVTGATIEGFPLHGGLTYLQVVGTRRLSTELGDVIDGVNRAARHRLALDYATDAAGHPSTLYCQGDQASYARYGIPAAQFTTGGHADYHEVTDEAQYIDYPHMAAVLRFVEDVAVHLSNLDHRVHINAAPADARDTCRQ